MRFLALLSALGHFATGLEETGSLEYIQSLEANVALDPLQPAPFADVMPELSCDPEAYNFVMEYETIQGVWKFNAACEADIRDLTRLQFGPPTTWEIFNVMCKGPCREYQHRQSRLALAEERSQCACTDLHLKCPISSTNMLLKYTGLYYDPTELWEGLCGPQACGRWDLNEVDYQTSRKGCGLLASGAVTAAPAGAALTGLLLAMGALLR